MMGTRLRDFYEEMAVVCVGTFVLASIILYSYYLGGPVYYSLPVNFAISAGASFFLVFPFVRIIRYAYVYRAYPVLYLPYLFFFNVLLFVGYGTYKDYIHKSPTFEGSLIFFLVTLAALLIYSILILIERRRGLFKRKTPAWRIQMLRSLLTRKQRFTMVFPDRYVKFLDTGDEKYLKGIFNG